ncbi:hypothetical protein HQ40_03995 [Porphyromonas gulae]|uniref:hypothetical protein n=1 Tax=Porphyromonas gulae TaxID=111105 RepID=UPI00052D3E72|nr:hypothetical protein [Porphyromonas gulae]KGN75970.1 hypothetical protein HQ40_03995 [Porphyromonas gulae]
MNDNFSELKERILASARSAQACREQYKRAYSSETAEELMEVIKYNFHWCVGNKVLTIPLIEEYRELFTEHGIHCNESVDSGYLLADNATVRASGNATVRASDNATVQAWGNATVRAWGNATVRASDNATVQAWGNATVHAWDNATVQAWDNATVRAWGNATVQASDNATVHAWDNATVHAWDNATVQASDNAYITSYDIIECRLSDKAIHRIRETNTIRVASDALKFEKIYENRTSE